MHYYESKWILRYFLINPDVTYSQDSFDIL